MIDVLAVRAVLNGILFLILFAGAIFLFRQSLRQNGITKAMAFTSLFASLYVLVLMILGFIDVCLPENYPLQAWIRYWWNWIAFAEILSLGYLAKKLFKE